MLRVHIANLRRKIEAEPGRAEPDPHRSRDRLPLQRPSAAPTFTRSLRRGAAILTLRLTRAASNLWRMELRQHAAALAPRASARALPRRRRLARAGARHWRLDEALAAGRRSEQRPAARVPRAEQLTLADDAPPARASGCVTWSSAPSAPGVPARPCRSPRLERARRRATRLLELADRLDAERQRRRARRSPPANLLLTDGASPLWMRSDPGSSTTRSRPR